MKTRKSIDTVCQSDEEKVLELIGKNWIVDQGIVLRYGFDAALALSYFTYWHFYKKKEHRDFKEGLYWTYVSVAELLKTYTCSTRAKMRAALQQLVEDGALYETSFTKQTGDKTKWYALNENNVFIAAYLRNVNTKWKNRRELNVENNQPIGENRQSYGGNNQPIGEINQSLGENRQSIPNNNTNNNTNVYPNRFGEKRRKNTGLFSLEGWEDVVC